ncbi:RagB/SusD family nutrient uptake outer membrane protein [Flavobacterium sp. SM2513]|uniref:RagB/SusD family nutrient uptake outer membrane protein n=1 Tax=Flavobacterium sp. SM2513 TaxID=3424766 RepID=UPI003D7F2653
MKNSTYTTIHSWIVSKSKTPFYKHPLMFLVASILLNSCDEFVAVDLPGDQLFTESVFEEPATATAAVVEIYAKMRKNGVLDGSSGGVPYLLANYSDDMDFYGGDHLGAFPFYKNSLTGVNPEVARIWDNSYNQIYCANAVLDGLARSTTLSDEVKNQLTGEALFARALLHFSLTNVFGPVPYIKTIAYTENQKAYRNTTQEVYNDAKADVEQAITLLAENYLSSDRTRPNTYVAKALLARICLYQGTWEEASNAASAVLNQTDLYGIESDLSKVFLNTSKTTIWQLSPSGSNKNTAEGALYVIKTGPPTMSAVSPSLLNAFEPGDLRRLEWIKSVTAGSTTWYYPNKYKENKNSTPSKESSIVFRTAEMYLIRAEARAQSGFLISAKEDLDHIRQLAGLPPTTALTQTDLLQAILKERQVELFTEFGHRFFDLKRAGKLDSVLSATKPGWNADDVWFPIPELELNLNPNLRPQNQGY